MRKIKIMLVMCILLLAMRVVCCAMTAIEATDMGISLQKENKLEQAEACFLQAIEANPDLAFAYLSLGNLYMEMEKYDEALSIFGRASILFPNYLEFKLCMGKVYGVRNDLDGAIAMYDRLIKNDRADAVSYYAKALILEDFKQYEQAITVYDELILFYPLDADVYFHLGLCQYETGRYLLSVASFQKVIEQNPDDAKAYYYLGLGYAHLLGKQQDMLEAMSKAVVLDPTNVQYIAQKALAYYKLSEFDLAIETYKQAIVLDPQNAQYYVGAGTCLVDLAMYEQANDMFDSALLLDSQNALAYYGQSIALEALGHKEQARFALKMYAKYKNTLPVVNKVDMQTPQPKTDAIVLELDDSRINTDTEPFILNDRTMVPMRVIFEGLGATVQWDAIKQTVTATKGDMQIVLTISSNLALVNQSSQTLEAAPTIRDGRTFVPVRFISEALGAKVNWAADERRVSIVSKERQIAREREISFKDKALEAVIRAEIGQPDGAMTVGDVMSIRKLVAENRQIVNLEGIQNLSNLQSLSLSYNQISDITPLSKLAHLQTLNIRRNYVTDISSINTLQSLENLYFDYNCVNDISSLEPLTHLQALTFAENQVMDIQAISALKDLQTLNVRGNAIMDIKPLASLTKLKAFYLTDDTLPTAINDALYQQYEQLQVKIEDIIAKNIRKDAPQYLKASNIHRYLTQNAVYDYSDNPPNFSHLPYGVLVKKTGVCDSYALAVKMLMTKAGLDCIVVYAESDGVKHAWNIVKVDGQTYHMDVTWDDTKDEEHNTVVYHTYFLVTDEEMANSHHQWDRKKYPSCTKHYE
ncbi:MAG: tetratricopeptide repeat protein [Hyphomonadaceae bacterium]|nr:tetratricopeptide repeat protein [Clostridia bacterium]